jgi:hypothetical protein
VTALADWQSEPVSENLDPGNPLRPHKGTVPLAEMPYYRDVLRADPCAYCGRKGGTLDHIASRHGAKGPNAWTNLSGACLRCNMEKGSGTLLMFLAKRAGLKRAKRMHELAWESNRWRMQKPKVMPPIIGRRARRRLPVYW